MYRFERDDVILEIEGNRGTISLYAADPKDALNRAQQIFPHSRDRFVSGTAGRYVVEFKVDKKYNRALFNKARKLARLPLTREDYEALDPLEKYMALLYARLTGKETFLGDASLLPGALMALRNELLRRGHISKADDLMDYDIVVHNVVDSES